MMNPKTRNRLIGGAALLCLLIIVAPLLNREPEDIGAQAPSPPPPPSLQPSGEAEAVSADRQQESIDARFSEWNDFEKNQNKQETAAKPGQCRLRIGIFAKPESIMQRLRDDGRQVSLSHWGENPAGDRLFAVHVGGAMACAEAESLRDELQQRYDMQPLIEYNTQTP